MTDLTPSPTIRVATPADVPAITDIVDEAYRPYIARIGKPPAPMLDDYAARVAENTVWVIEERAEIVGVVVLKPASKYLLLEISLSLRGGRAQGWAADCSHLRRPRHGGTAVSKFGSIRMK